MEYPDAPFVHPAERPNDFFAPGTKIAVCDPFFEHAVMDGVFYCSFNWAPFKVHSLVDQRQLPAEHEIPEQCVVFLAEVDDLPLVLEAGLHDFNIMRWSEYAYLQEHPADIPSYLSPEPLDGAHLDPHTLRSHELARHRL